MLSAFKFRLYPNEEQENTLNNQMKICKWLYNRAYHERMDHYEETGKGLTCVEQLNELPEIKKKDPELTTVYSQVLQNVLERLDMAFKNFFSGRTRYPRTKPFISSITYPQASPQWICKHSITLPKIGRIRMIKNRIIKGRIKTITVKKYKSGEWYAIIVTETKDRHATAQKEIKNPVGVDSGLTNYIYLSDGAHVDNPKFIKQHEKRIKKAQKSLSKKKKGSKNRKKAKLLLAKRWNDYDNVKDDWQWKLAGALVSKYDLIAYENLSIRNMVKNHCLAGAIQDAAWGTFWGKVKWKAQQNGTLALACEPKYSTQECPICHVNHKMALSERTFVCPSCGYIADRDYKAGVILLQRVLVGLGMPEFTPVEIPTVGRQLGASRVSLKQETSSYIADEPRLGDNNIGSSHALE
jgi:putative transposase